MLALNTSAKLLTNRMLESDVYDFVFQSPSEEKIRQMATSPQIEWKDINPDIRKTYDTLLSGLRFEEFKGIVPFFENSQENEKNIYKIMAIYNTYRFIFPQFFPELCFVLAINIAFETKQNRHIGD